MHLAGLRIHNVILGLVDFGMDKIDLQKLIVVINAVEYTFW
jgi:hypothetical protein